MKNKLLNATCSKYRSILKNYAHKFTNDPDEIQDLVQETLLRALKYTKEWFDNPKVTSWLYVIMKNIYINHYRSKQYYSHYISSKYASNSDQGISEPYEHMDMEKLLLVEQVKKAIIQFPCDHANLFLDYLNGYKYHELSETFDIPVGTVKSRIHTIRKSLQSKFKNIYLS